MKDLKNRVAIVTGASRGMGPHLARALAAEGVHVAVAARNTDQLDAVAADLREMGVKSITVPTDVADLDALVALVATSEAELGPVDILVNNAGLEELVFFADETPAHIDWTIRVNLLGTLQLTRLVLPGMLQRGQGHIVNVASITARKGAAYNASYSASKAGQLSFSSALRAEVGDKGIGVSCIIPGFVLDTGMYARFKLKPPLLLGGTPMAPVSRAMIRAIRRNTPEVVVNSMPLRYVFMLDALSARIGDFLVWLSGITPHQRKLAQIERELGGSSKPS